MYFKLDTTGFLIKVNVKYPCIDSITQRPLHNASYPIVIYNLAFPNFSVVGFLLQRLDQFCHTTVSSILEICRDYPHTVPE